MRPCLAERRARDYKRNGTTTLFAALETVTGKAAADACYPWHRHPEAFGKDVPGSSLRDLEVGLSRPT